MTTETDPRAPDSERKPTTRRRTSERYRKPGSSDSARIPRPNLPIRCQILSSDDVQKAEQDVAELAGKLGFMHADISVISDAVQRIARNVVAYARRGGLTARQTVRGLRIEIWDNGPGFPPDVLRNIEAGGAELAPGSGIQVILSTHMVDEFTVFSLPGTTQVIMEKFLWVV